ncbi:MAG: Uma2 family endonuclease [Streptomyces sp.]|nr:Uma2 family endonuclease [Streptomyces sp.]
MGGTMTAEAESRTRPSEPRQPDGSPWPIPPEGGYSLDDLYTLDLPPHTQLIDGSLVFVSPQRKFHSLAIDLLVHRLRSLAPDHLRVRREMAVVISPRTVPEPDVIVVNAEADADEYQTRYDVADIVLAIEVVSPDSEARDRDYKPHKYAHAGIPHFWRVEMDERAQRPVVYVFELEPTTKTYVPTGIHRNQFKVEVPYPITVDLTEIDRM